MLVTFEWPNGKRSCFKVIFSGAQQISEENDKAHGKGRFEHVDGDAGPLKPEHGDRAWRSGRHFHIVFVPQRLKALGSQPR